MIGKLKLETAPELDLEEAVVLGLNLILLVKNKKFRIAIPKERNIKINTLRKIIKILCRLKKVRQAINFCFRSNKNQI